MKPWPVQDAKAHFSEFLQACLTQGPQMVTKRGQEAAILVPVGQWRQLQALAAPSLKQVLLDPAGPAALVTVARGRARARKPVAL